jgi:hypothetical protein
MHIPASLLRGTAPHRSSFLNAHPFRHVVIDNFFEDDFAERLLEEFPAFDRRLAKAEGGEIGGKAVNTRIADIGPAYHELYREIASKHFLDFVSELSGIPDLILDPAMFGGGTHENLHGQELDPHVDFNYDESEQLHRRLNLIVYLNKGWKPEWGGGLEIHSNPRRPDEDRVHSYDPIFNRAVMFETNEYSWHGFSKISLPEEHRRESRKSISIYLYTKDRPPEEIAPRHATFYVQRPLPDRFKEGYTLLPDDVDELSRLLIRRDRWIELYQKMELEMNALTSSLSKRLQQVEESQRVPLTGYIRQEGPVSGFHSDLWAGPAFHLRLAPVERVTALELGGFRPEGTKPGRISILVDGVEVAKGSVAPGPFSFAVPLRSPRTAPFELDVRFEGPSASSGDDERDLSWLLLNLSARHATR